MGTFTNTIAGGASYNFYLDSEKAPFASIPAVKTSNAIDFVRAESAIGSITGVHKVTLKFNNHTSSLLSVEFADASITSVKQVKPTGKYKVYSIKNSIIVDGLDKNNVAVYSITGKLIYKKNAQLEKLNFL